MQIQRSADLLWEDQRQNELRVDVEISSDCIFCRSDHRRSDWCHECDERDETSRQPSSLEGPILGIRLIIRAIPSHLQSGQRSLQHVWLHWSIRTISGSCSEFSGAVLPRSRSRSSLSMCDRLGCRGGCRTSSSSSDLVLCKRVSDMVLFSFTLVAIRILLGR